MVNIFGDDSSGKVGPAGPPGPAGVGGGGLKEVIRWFPELALEEIRKNVNFATFLVENVPPTDDHPDVELTRDNKRVLTWFSYNHRSINKKRMATRLKPYDSNTKPAELKKITPPLNIDTQYGLKFKQEEKMCTK